MRENLDLIGFLSLGLLGGFGHCLGMCGPFVLYISRRFCPKTAQRGAVLGQQTLYGLGRVTTYGAMGVVAGAMGGALDLAGSMLGLQRAAAVIAGVLLVFYGSFSLLKRLPFLSTGGGALFARVAGLVQKRSPNNSFVMGLLLGLLPCGLVYTAVIAAAARGGALAGGVGLVLFGLGTLPALLGLSVVDELWVRHRAWINRLSGVLLVFMGGWFIWQGYGAS